MSSWDPNVTPQSNIVPIALVARQAIYDHALNVYAYELLYRQEQSDCAAVMDGDAATARVMLNTFLDIGLETMVGEYLAFLNITRGIILERSFRVLPKNRVVLEVLETIEPDECVVEALRDATKQGYIVALDDFEFRDSLRPFLDLASIVKIDIRALSPETLEEHVSLLRGYSVKLLAEKVETHEEFDWCRGLGFEYFQGYFFCKPKIVEGKRLPAQKITLLTLLAKLQDPSITISELEGLIKHDLSLSYKILRYVNSAYWGLPKTVTSIGQAACFVGLDRLRAWMSLIILSSVEDKPFELLVLAAVRAQMCQLLGMQLRPDRAEQFFTVGLFSVLDSLFDRDMKEIVETLPLASEIVGALVAYEGLLGRTLQCVVAYERGEWEAARCENLASDIVRDAYLSAIEWAFKMLAPMR